MRNMKKQIKIRNIRNVTLSAAFAACPIWSRTMSARAGWPNLGNKLDQGTLGMSDPLQLTFDQLGTDRTS